MSKKLLTLLTIGGSDPTGGAGIQADIRTGNSLGLHVASVITAVTSQNSRRFSNLGAVPKSLLLSQLQMVFEEEIPSAIKIGMIGNSEQLKLIAGFIEKNVNHLPIVSDPVLKATSDSNNNIDPILVEAYKRYLFPISTVVTPNIPELEIFSTNTNWSILPSDLNCEALVIKGGHSNEESISDILIQKNGGDISFCKYEHNKIDGKNFHGTGCVFSSLLASFLALGLSLTDAFFSSCEKIQTIILQSQHYELGNSINGPLNIAGSYKV